MSGFFGSSNNSATRTPPHSRDMLRPSFANSFAPKREGAARPSREGAGKTGCALHPRSHVQGNTTNAHEHTGSAETLRPSPRNGFTAYLRALPGETIACLSPSPPGSVSFLKNLTHLPSGASGPHDFAVRFSRARQSQLPRPSLPAPTSVTMANAPSTSGRDARNKQLIWVRSQE